MQQKNIAQNSAKAEPILKKSPNVPLFLNGYDICSLKTFTYVLSQQQTR